MTRLTNLLLLAAAAALTANASPMGLEGRGDMEEKRDPILNPFGRFQCKQLGGCPKKSPGGLSIAARGDQQDMALQAREPEPEPEPTMENTEEKRDPVFRNNYICKGLNCPGMKPAWGRRSPEPEPEPEALPEPVPVAEDAVQEEKRDPVLGLGFGGITCKAMAGASCHKKPKKTQKTPQPRPPAAAVQQQERRDPLLKPLGPICKGTYEACFGNKKKNSKTTQQKPRPAAAPAAAVQDKRDPLFSPLRPICKGICCYNSCKNGKSFKPRALAEGQRD
ncbi:hypothetical protein B0H63DRAFT_451100 [Podospora didyma]|uniref:Uncharacterized protein n=1 Tax=Podospora didyma TaxID=330526 RepID=A0AAE0TW87_9PEZI|nr:hypothetical protein B0H63DRAFT_451100 [Podospora didyma]